MSATNLINALQYVPFSSFVNPSFWHTLTDIKLDVDKLDETSKKIHGRFTYLADISSVFEVDGTSFNKSPESDLHYQNVYGILINKNTIEDFKSADKGSLVKALGEQIWLNVKNKTWISNPNSLLSFVILSFADLKKFHYLYWFAFPSPSQPTVYVEDNSTTITTIFNNKELEQLLQGFKTLERSQQAFFVVIKEENNVEIKPLSEILKLDEEINKDLSKIYFTFADPSNGKSPGWPLRLFVAALLEHCPCLINKNIQVIGLRCKLNGNIDCSQIFKLKIPQDIQGEPNWVGWERNDKGKFGPKLSNMSASMDPIKLAETSSDLNIKLMKWRLVPNLDVDVMKSTKCLLLGSGTLGCHVARDLLAWGFRHITFLDSGNVSYSNPTRQVLFNYKDCLGGGRKKAEAAADNLKLILPTVNSKGLIAHIPMPGHPVGETLKEETISNIRCITDAIAEHDVVFLLLDTREARWMPTLIAAHYGKIVINAALGFDSYMVIRHGAGGGPAETSADVGSGDDASASASTSVNDTFVPGEALGCYFCNDVTAPGDSLKDRTLDQQCTVTRPGSAAIAGALAVEILVALLQHPLRARAPAVYNLTADTKLHPEMEGVLGAIPHSIRGFLHSYQTVVPTCPKFVHCIACSDLVIDQYRQNGIEFLLNVFNSGSYLEEVTGLAAMNMVAEMTEILELTDEDTDD